MLLKIRVFDHTYFSEWGKERLNETRKIKTEPNLSSGIDFEVI